MSEMILLDFNAVSRKVGLSRKTIYCRIREGDFPRQVKIGCGFHAIRTLSPR